MKVLMINVVCGIRSTGRICTDLAADFEAKGDQVIIAYGRETVPKEHDRHAVRIGSETGVRCNALSARFFDNDGFCAHRATKEFLDWADTYDPDLLWLHNLHGYYLDIEQLFTWIKSRPSMKVKWTLHDCWSFTGHCAYFSFAKCEKWRDGCHDCAQKRAYPTSFLLDRSKENYQKKKAAFTGVRDMTLITPSNWLAGLVKQSFLKAYPVEVHYNRINTSIFKPTPSDFRERYHLKNKKIVLGVASTWEKRKGLDDFIKLSTMLDNEYVVVLVGLTEKQIQEIPKRILGIRATNSAKELAMIYTAADVFLNPTYEDNYPTVNLEAKACGTPVVTYNTGGSPESVEADCVFEPGDLEGAAAKIIELCEKRNGSAKEE